MEAPVLKDKSYDSAMEHLDNVLVHLEERIRNAPQDRPELLKGLVETRQRIQKGIAFHTKNKK